MNYNTKGEKIDTRGLGVWIIVKRVITRRLSSHLNRKINTKQIKRRYLMLALFYILILFQLIKNL